MFDKTLIDMIPQMKTGAGFFSAFIDPVWAEEFDTPARLDMFFAMTYGQKHPAPLLEMFKGEDGTISAEDVNAIASIIYDIRGHEWAKLYDVLIAEYSPIDNTDVTETETETRTGSGTDGNTRTLNTSTTNSGSGSVTNSASGSGNTSSNVYGFDSVNPVGDSTGSDSSTTQSSTSTETSNTVADSGTITDAGTHSDSESITRSKTRKGNIGVATPADLLGGTVEMWQWTFIIQVMNDICDLIALKVY